MAAAGTVIHDEIDPAASFEVALGYAAFDRVHASATILDGCHSVIRTRLRCASSWQRGDCPCKPRRASGDMCVHTTGAAIMDSVSEAGRLP
jgi:hypothetical protein